METTNANAIEVICPSTVAVDQEFSIGVRVVTDPYPVGGACYHRLPTVRGRYNLSPRGIAYMDRVPEHWEDTARIEGSDGYQGPGRIDFSQGSGPYADDHRPIRRVGPVRFTKPGIASIRVTDTDTGITGRGNPVQVSTAMPEAKLFWGDIHSQTFFSDGLRCPEELYAFARDEAFLDIFAVSDHAESLTDRQWDYFTRVANDSYAPGDFVTLIGLEWTSRKWGHRNVYYPGDHGPILRSNDAAQGNISEVYKTARAHHALVIPHHSANHEMGVDWSLAHDPELERLVEIYSVWGNSERPRKAGNSRPIRAHGGEEAGQHVMDALSGGYTFGFIGGGDIHDGRPGDDLHVFQAKPEGYKQLYRQGIMGVWADELTSEAVFEALWNRRVFATTNVRTILRFSINGEPMGSEIPAADRLNIRMEAHSQLPIRQVDLVRNGEDADSVAPNDTSIVREWSEQGMPGWYYVRVTDSDGEMAWSSPVWVR